MRGGIAWWQREVTAATMTRRQPHYRTARDEGQGLNLVSAMYFMTPVVAS